MHEIPTLKFHSSGELIIQAPITSSEKDFNFLYGPSRIHHKILKTRLSGSNEWREFEGTSNGQASLNGTLCTEVYHLTTSDGTPYEGMALRFFDLETRLWSIYWAQSNMGKLGYPPEVGYFKENVGYFFSQTAIGDKQQITAFRWDAGDPQRPVWSQAISEDNGRTWEWNWHMYYDKTSHLH